MIDFHTHVLPGMDDGSASVEESIAMLRTAAAQGVTTVVATPHFYREKETADAFLERREKAEAILCQELEKYNDLPRVVVGAEVYYFPGISNSESLQKLTIGNSRYVMIEPPLPPWSERVFRDLEKIVLQQGLIPIVAHIDRYIRPFHTFGIPEKLAELTLVVQASCKFFTEKRTKNMALRMLKKGGIQLLGSDAHNDRDKAVNMEPAADLICKKLGEDMLEEIFQNSKRILGE